MPRERFHRKLSPLVNERFPEFVQTEYQTFVAFIKKYYEWMEQEGYPTERTERLLSFRDVDESPDPFLSYLKNEYLNSFPSSFAADTRHIIKNIDAYYQAKGTPQAFKFLFRVLYDVDTAIEIPWKKVVKLSAGTWQVDTVIKLSTLFYSDWQKAVGVKVRQDGSGATAIIDKVRQRYDVGQYITELYLHDIQGTFDKVGKVQADYVEAGLTRVVFGYPMRRMVTSVSVETVGTNYAVGDQLVFTPLCSGRGAKAFVSAVDENGGIRSINLTELGYNYEALPSITVQSENGSGAALGSTLGVTGSYAGYYLDNDGGYLSDGQVLQDSEYWQKFSYVIESDVSDALYVANYESTIKAAGHPAGMKMFGRVVIPETQDASQESNITTSVTTV